MYLLTNFNFLTNALWILGDTEILFADSRTSMNVCKL
jgi:hypothetical protein